MCHHCGNLPVFHECFRLFNGVTHSGSHVDQHTPLPGFRVPFGTIATKICKQIHPLAYHQCACVQVCMFSWGDWIAQRLWALCSLSPSVETSPHYSLWFIPAMSWRSLLECRCSGLCCSMGWRVGRHRRGLAGNGIGLRGMMGKGWTRRVRAQEVWGFLV